MGSELYERGRREDYELDDGIDRNQFGDPIDPNLNEDTVRGTRGRTAAQWAQLLEARHGNA